MRYGSALLAVLFTASFSAAQTDLRVIVGNRPSLLAVTVEIDRRPLSTTWDDLVAALFADADVNGDDSLDEREARRVLSALRIRQIGWGYLWAVPQAAPWSELDTSRDGKVTREELAGYYRRHFVDGPQFGIGQAPDPATLANAILQQLDTNRDGRVTEPEWKAAEAALRSLDRDGDEMIRPGELIARLTYPGSAGTALLAPGSKTVKSLARLSGSDPELATLRKQGPGSTLMFRLGETNTTEAKGEVNGLRLLAYTAPSTLAADFAADRKAALAHFAEADTDRDGALGAAEITIAGYAPLRDHVAFADRNGDGRLSQSEWDAYLALRMKLVQVQVNVAILDHGRGLFEAIDADGDGALSMRELRTVWQRLNALGCIRDGQLDVQLLPHSIRLVASRGRPQSLQHTPPRSGPAWFLAMDRNRDGDVSRREFLGTDEAFRRLDADNDGLLSASEAAAK